MILPDKKIIFIHIPKTGGSSIEDALSEYADEHVITGEGGRTYLRTLHGKGKIEEKINEFFNIDPDQYKHLTANEYYKFLGDEEYKKYFVFSVMRFPEERIHSLGKWAGQHLTPDFVDNIDKSLLNRSWSSGEQFLLDDNNNILVDKLLNFNNLDKEFSELMLFLGINDIKLQHLNKTDSPAHAKNGGHHDEKTYIEHINKAYINEINTYLGLLMSPFEKYETLK